MKPPNRAGQFKSWYTRVMITNNASVKAIFTNSQMKNVAGFAPPGLRAPATRRTAMTALGTTQHSPPSTAENIAAHPPISPAIKPATIVAIICRETKRSIFFVLSRQPCGTELRYGNYMNQRDYKGL